MPKTALNILFVCTGNTCRSPIAEGIATGMTSRMAARAKPGEPVARLTFSSAGIGAHAGAPRTPEGSQAVRWLGYAPAPGTSRPLTARLIAESDLIYAMTRSHMAGILALDPAAKDKVFLLDPAGADVHDPIGQSEDAYTQTARHIEGLIAQRVKEWRP